MQPRKKRQAMKYKRIKQFIYEILFPYRCINCGKWGLVVCAKCLDKIEPVVTPVCPECGRVGRLGEYCSRCRNRLRTALSGIVIAAQYDAGPLKEMIHKFKYEGIIELSLPLAGLIILRIKGKVPNGSLVVVPVPLSRKRELHRGFNQSEMLARLISESLGIPGGLALKRTRDTHQQVGLSGGERRQNLLGAFEVEDPILITGKTVLLVDDVLTTGSTLNECAKTLKLAGAKRVWGVVIARG